VRNRVHGLLLGPHPGFVAHQRAKHSVGCRVLEWTYDWGAGWLAECRVCLGACLEVVGVCKGVASLRRGPLGPKGPLMGPLLQHDARGPLRAHWQCDAR